MFVVGIAARAILFAISDEFAANAFMARIGSSAHEVTDSTYAKHKKHVK